MNRWCRFSLQELRELQDLLSNNIENVQCDSVDDDGNQLVDTSRQESMLEEIHREIATRLVSDLLTQQKVST